MFGPLGFPELLFILVLALLIFGPKRLPEVGRTIGKGMAQFRKATTDLKRTIESEISLEEEPARRPKALPPLATAPRVAPPVVAEASPVVETPPIAMEPVVSPVESTESTESAAGSAIEATIEATVEPPSAARAESDRTDGDPA